MIYLSVEKGEKVSSKVELSGENVTHLQRALDYYGKHEVGNWGGNYNLSFLQTTFRDAQQIEQNTDPSNNKKLALRVLLNLAQSEFNGISLVKWIKEVRAANHYLGLKDAKEACEAIVAEGYAKNENGFYSETF